MNEEKKEIIKLKEITADRAQEFEKFILSEAHAFSAVAKELTDNKKTYIELLEKIEYLVQTQDEEEYEWLEQTYQNNSQWDMAWDLYGKWAFSKNGTTAKKASEIN